MPKATKKFEISPKSKREIEKLIEKRVAAIKIKLIVKSLAEAQIKTKQRLNILTQRICDLEQKVSTFQKIVNEFIKLKNSRKHFCFLLWLLTQLPSLTLKNTRSQTT